MSLRRIARGGAALALVASLLVALPISAASAALPAGPQLFMDRISGVGDGWTTVALPDTYTDMVVVATPVYDDSKNPVVTRIRNASGSSFELRVQSPDGSAASGYDAEILVAEAGVYTLGADGITFEATTYNATNTWFKGTWSLDSRTYAQSYTNPVVVGQVMTYNDSDWSTFIAHGAAKANPPSASTIRTGKHVGEDPDQTRDPETVGYMVFEAGTYNVNGTAIDAGVGANVVRGITHGSAPFSYPIGIEADNAVLTQAGIKGGDGTWAVHDPSSLPGTPLLITVDEDTVGDAERNHITEQVAWVAALDVPPPSGDIKLLLDVAPGIDDSWTTINLPESYTDMVVVATPVYDQTRGPVVPRIRNATGSSFELKLQSANGPVTGTFDVEYLVVEAGVYTQAVDGITLEATKYSANNTYYKGKWGGDLRSYQQSYTSPVVLGQVMTYNDTDWSSFFTRGSSQTGPPNAVLRVGKQVGEDPDKTRAAETLGVVVVEAGTYNIEGTLYNAGVGADIVRGITHNNVPFAYPLSINPERAVLTQAGVDGGDGSWPVHDPASLPGSPLLIAVDEDTMNDGERNHTTEQVAWFAREEIALTEVDLSVTKDDGGVTVLAGGTIVYSIDYANAGLGATGVELSDTVPANTTFNAGASTPGWVCSPDANPGSTCTLAIGAVGIGGNGSADFAVDVVSPLDAGVDEISNTVTISDDGASGPDGNPADNTDSDTTPVDAAPDLVADKDDGAVTVEPGDTIIFTLQVDNNGDQGATGVVLTDTVPANTTFNPAASTGGWSCLPDNSSGSTCTFNLGPLPAGASASPDFAVDVDDPLPAGITEVSNTFSAADDGTNGPDQTPGDNSDSDTTPVDAAPDLSVMKDDGNDVFEIGQVITYAIDYDNVGNQGATGVVITDTVPAGTTFDSAGSTAGWSCSDGDPAGTVCTFSIGALAVGGGASIDFAVEAVSGTTTTNTVSIADDGANGADPNVGNNTDDDVTPPVMVPPVVTPSVGVTPFIEDLGAVTVDGAITVTDADDVTLASATVTITNLLDGGDEVLACNACGGIAAVFAGGTLTLTGSDTIANYQTALQSVTYDNASDSPDTTDRIIRFVANDGTGDSNNGDKTVSVTATNDPPMLTVPSTLDAIGNVGIDVPAASGLIDAATIVDPDFAGPFTVGGTVPTGTTGGGTVSINADGSFTYTPAAGFDGIDTFDYQVCDNGSPLPSECSTPQTMSIDVGDVIWFIDNTAGGSGGTGTLNDPFLTLGDFNGSAGPAVGDNIFLHETGTDYIGGVVLLDNQTLIGEGVTGADLATVLGIVPEPPHTNALPGIGGPNPVIGNASGDGISLALDNTVRGLDVGNTPAGHGLAGVSVGSPTVTEVGVSGSGGILEVSTGGDLSGVSFDSQASTSTAAGDAGIDLTGVTGTFGGDPSISGSDFAGIHIKTSSGTFMFGAASTIANTTFDGVLIDGSNPNFTYSGTINNSSGQSVRVRNTTAATVNFGGTITDTGNGISLTNNAGSALTFSGANSSLATASATAINLNSNSSSTFNFTGGGLDIDTTSGIGLGGFGGGTLTITGAGNTIDTSVGGRAVSLNGIAIGAGGVTFASITKAPGGPNQVGIGIDSVSGGTFQVTGTATVNFTAGTNPGIDIANSSATFTFGSVDIDSTGGEGIKLSGANGPVTVSGGNIDGSTGTAVDINGGTASVVIDAAITNSTGRSVEILNRTGGSASFGAAIDDDGDGIFLLNNTGSAINFTGGLALDTGVSSGFIAESGGTVNVTGLNTIGGSGAISGTGVIIRNTAIGGSGVTFQSIDVNGAANGILLENSGGGTFTVTGNGGTCTTLTPTCTGGRIQNTIGTDGLAQGNGVYLNNTGPVSLSFMRINDHPNFAIRGNTVGGFTLANSLVEGVNGTSTSNDEGSISFDNLTGTGTVSSSAISGGLEDNIVVTNNTGTLNLNVTNSTIGLNSTASGNDGILVESQSSATLNLSVTNTDFLGARGDMVQCNAIGNSIMDCTLEDNDFDNGHTNIVPGGGGITVSGGGAGSDVTVTYDISGTTPGGQTIEGAVGNAITVNSVNGGGSFSGTIENNHIGAVGESGSGSTTGSGIFAGAAGTMDHTVTINNNVIREVDGYAGIDVLFNSNDVTQPEMDATITNNTITDLGGTVFTAASLQVAGAGTENGILNLDLRGNTFDAGGAASGGNAVYIANLSSVSDVNVYDNANATGYSGSPNGEFAFNCPPGTASVDLDTFLSQAPRSNVMTNGGFPLFVGGVDASVVCGVTGAPF